ncbi:MAG: hypothetical protein U5L96_14100 [Owenweeksia sp.]|nr:hypothetical protein [Owenweeksia sp.]
MNFLAHLALSNNDDDIMLGNFIADSLRSKQWSQFKPEVIEGVKLHHKIDFFTDHHPVVERSKARLRDHQSKYSPVVVDILYDHFLAHNFENTTLHHYMILQNVLTPFFTAGGMNCPLKYSLCCRT